jgi:hypothetical protein
MGEGDLSEDEEDTDKYLGLLSSKRKTKMGSHGNIRSKIRRK